MRPNPEYDAWFEAHEVFRLGRTNREMYREIFEAGQKAEKERRRHCNCRVIHVCNLCGDRVG